MSEPEVWVDCDYLPRPRRYEKCGKCGNDLLLTHQCADMAVLTDEFLDSIDDAIEGAMARHESENSDSVCSCGVVNNMDGDVLFSHRVGAVVAAVRLALGLTQGPL